MVRIISNSHFKAAIILLLVLIGFLLGSLHPKVQVQEPETLQFLWCTEQNQDSKNSLNETFCCDCKL